MNRELSVLFLFLGWDEFYILNDKKMFILTYILVSGCERETSECVETESIKLARKR